MTEPSFAVIGARLCRPPEEVAGAGASIVARMTLAYGALVITDAALFRSREGEMRLALPKCGRHRRIAIRSGALREQLHRAALAAFHALATGEGPSAEPPSRDGLPTETERPHDPARAA